MLFGTIKPLSLTFSIIQIPTEHDYQASEKRDNKQRGDIVVMLFRVFEIKNLNPRINNQIRKNCGENGI